MPILWVICHPGTRLRLSLNIASISPDQFNRQVAVHVGLHKFQILLLYPGTVTKKK